MPVSVTHMKHTGVSSSGFATLWTPWCHCEHSPPGSEVQESHPFSDDAQCSLIYLLSWEVSVDREGWLGLCSLLNKQVPHMLCKMRR